MTRPARVADLVGLRPHPTVVRLEHLDAENAAWISESFLRTPGVDSNLQALARAFERPNGCGAFLVGHYGSGKSHFLAFLTQQLRAGDFCAGSPDTAAVSMLNFSAQTRLEDAIASALSLPSCEGDRRPAWSALVERHPAGLVLLIDELSEFLRSKPDPQSFNEDIRFLQFLGEWCQSHRFWVVAAMQEEIEHTGALEDRQYRKIKDRFPLLLLLTPSHVRDLVSESILIKKPGYSEQVAMLAETFEAALPDQLFDRATFSATYPIHPATLSLLEEVRSCFSQARGVVDFVVHQLGGDTARGIEPFLEQPWGSLLTPDKIVEHFLDRFEVQPEFLPVSQRLFPYYAENLSGLFDSEKLHALARRMLHLLLLVHISPRRDGLSAEEAAAWLLLAVSRLDPSRSLTVASRVLETLAAKGRYVKQSGRRFRLDLEDDASARLEHLLAREVAEIQDRSDMVFEMLVPLLPHKGFNPFMLRRDTWQSRRILWHFHERPCAVYLGNGPPPRQEGVTLCIRLPWGAAEGGARCATIRPAPISLSHELIELAALSRLRDAPLGRETTQKLERRISERSDLLYSQIKNAYAEALFISPEGEEQRSLRIDTSRSFEHAIEQFGCFLFRRSFPGFERFAPSHGRLPREAYLQFARFALFHDLCAEQADAFVDLVREAYLVPMKLLVRQGRGYRLPSQLDSHELIGCVRPLIQLRPVPEVIYKTLEAPIYGLVPDQIHVLLIFLYLQGELDLLLGERSYRQAFETVPLPLQFDRVVPVQALGAAQLTTLTTLVEGFGLKAPRQWTALAQRKLIVALSGLAREQIGRLQTLSAKLEKRSDAQAIRRQLDGMVAHWRGLQGADPFEAFGRFAAEIEPAKSFVERANALAALPEVLERRLADLDRLRFLLARPELRGYPNPGLVQRLEQIGPPPGLDAPEALASWIEQGQAFYEAYVADYSQRHRAWWSAWKEEAWSLPEVARSRHLGLERRLQDLRRLEEALSGARCQALGDLSFRPQCGCRFDGQSAVPVVEVSKALAAVRSRIDADVRVFFRRSEVIAKVAAWHESGEEPCAQTSAYLRAEVPFPGIRNLAAFDRHLAGLALEVQVPLDGVVALLQERSWERQQLLDALDKTLAPHDPARLRFSHDSPGEEPLASWCAERLLQSGRPLPDGLALHQRSAISGAIRREWVGARALAGLESLGLTDEGLSRVLGWLLDGSLPAARAEAGLVAAVAELQDPTVPQNAAELARLSELLYRAHPRLFKLAGQTWLERLDSLATSRLKEWPPPLETRLQACPEAAWLLLDCLGLPLLGPVQALLAELLAGWSFESVEFAHVGETTTTQACYRALSDAGIGRGFEKLDALDRLIHERFVPLDDLFRLLQAELRLELRTRLARLDPARPLVVFADHGFRIGPLGRDYRHGGPSTLERVVPLLHLGPRRSSPRHGSP